MFLSARLRYGAIRRQCMTCSLSYKSPQLLPKAREILDFWFEGCEKGHAYQSHLAAKWFQGNTKLDEVISKSFKSDVERLAAGEYEGWRYHPHNNLAAIIMSDQFTRSIYRGTPQMFELDPLAVDLAQYSLDRELIKQLGDVERMFIPLPFEHAEDLASQQMAVRLYSTFAEEAKAKYGADHVFLEIVEGSKSYAELHRDVIAKYGRFPHRNVVLGRQSTSEELTGLENGTIPRF